MCWNSTVLPSRRPESARPGPQPLADGELYFPTVSSSVHSIEDFISRQQCMGEEAVVDNRCLIAVAPVRVSRSSCCVPDHGDLKSLLDEVAHMGLDAHVREHSAEDNSSYS